MRRRFGAAAAALIWSVAPLGAADVDSEHLFGLTEGSDIGAAGERELELEFAARGGKHGGTYRVLSPAASAKLVLTDSFRVALSSRSTTTASAACPASTTAIDGRSANSRSR